VSCGAEFGGVEAGQLQPYRVGRSILLKYFPGIPSKENTPAAPPGTPGRWPTIGGANQ
jgi:hypothetical protein